MVVLDVEEVERVNVAGKVTENSQADVDEKIGSAASHDGNADWRDWDWLVELNTFSRDARTKDDNDDEDDCRNHVGGSN